MSATKTIAPITGMLRKKFFIDLTIGLGGGTIAAYTFWNHRESLMDNRERKLRELRIAQNLPVSQ